METIVRKKLDTLLKEAPVVPLEKKDRILIMSDLHLGDGSNTDDFLSNSQLVETLLKDYYLKKNFQLVLNGDIEELHRYSMKSIVSRWESMYNLFMEFRRKTALYKIVGNHDHPLLGEKEHQVNENLHSAITFDYKGNRMLVYHGHQASMIIERFYGFAGFLLRYIATPLGIKNYTVAHNNRKKFRLERRIYQFSRNRKVISIIGHTHRPLFESMSKIDSLKYKIEKLCRDYPHAGSRNQRDIRRRIQIYRAELQGMDKQEREFEAGASGIYHDELLVPAMFNSGCTIGKRGATAIEIVDGTISLVHWFNRNISDKYLNFNGYTPERVGETDYYRVIIKQEHLDYIMARTELLA